MSQWQQDKANAAVQSLFRVRAAETPLDPPGSKSVWHQGAKGADLLSYVDPAGCVNEQAFTLLDDHFVWKSQVGLRSGAIGAGVGATGGKASEEIVFDRILSAERLQRAAAALATYEGDDKYIRHIRSVLQLAVNGLSMEDEAQVTNVVTLEPEPSKASTGSSSSLPAPLWAIATGVVAMLAVGAWLFLR